MTDLKKNFEEFYFKMTTHDKKNFIGKALTALTRPLKGASLPVQELNQTFEERLGAKFSRNFQKELLEKLGFKKNIVNGKVVYTGISLREQVEQEKNSIALINESYLKENGI